VKTACELGFGQGMSVNLHAAASTVHWCGTDFNPAHAAFAQDLARSSGVDARLYDESFEQFCARTDLPDFDHIGLHGIWSWVSDENRHHIVDFIRRKLKVGGALYISYNTQPGWTAMLPLRELLTAHSEIMGADGAGLLNRVDGALTFVDKLMATNPGYARANPGVADRLRKIREQNRHYVAHEYFNGHWEPMSFAKMASWLQPAKMQWACSAHLLDGLDSINLSADQQTLLNEIPDPMFRQTVRDFCVNQQFRRDFWVKGGRSMNNIEQLEALRNLRVVLVQPRASVALKVNGGMGEAKLQEPIYNPILDVLADHQPRSLAQLEKALDGKKITFAQLVQAVTVLAGSGALTSAQSEEDTAQARPRTDRLNADLMHRARTRSEMAYLGSPVTGGGLPVGRFAQLFLLGRESGLKTSRELAEFAWGQLAAQGERLRKDGNTLTEIKDNIAELEVHAKQFLEGQLPAYIALQITR
jgi:Predicted methyltransferase regulatory domain